MAYGLSSLIPLRIPIHQAIVTLGNLQQSAQNVKVGGVLEVVSAANERQNRLNRAIPEYPATDTLKNS